MARLRSPRANCCIQHCLFFGGCNAQFTRSFLRRKGGEFFVGSRPCCSCHLSRAPLARCLEDEAPSSAWRMYGAGCWLYSTNSKSAPFGTLFWYLPQHLS